jgi:signal transduction histidine kinase/ActR/RegA family two-component response regulator
LRAGRLEQIVTSAVPVSAPHVLQWHGLPKAARAYVAIVLTAGTIAIIAAAPTTLPHPALFASLLVAACLTSIWKVNLPLALACGSTLSVSYAANLMALLLLGPRPAVVVAIAGAWTQCTVHVKQRYPPYRTLFSVAGEAVTMAATGIAYVWLGGRPASTGWMLPAGPLVGAIATYFLVNTGLVAGAIALSTDRTFWRVWRDDFLWSGAAYMVAGTAGAIAAIIVAGGDHWTALLMAAPVYLTYRTYKLFVGRIEDQKRYLEETRKLHEQTVAALATAKEANRLKDQFLATVSHELRTPLNAILGWADMLCTGRIAEGRRGRACRAIYDSARLQAQLIDELLDVARIMSGKLRLERRSVKLADVVRGALQIVQPAAVARRIHIAIDVDAPIAPLWADGARLQQVVWNLLSNAVKFTPEGGAVLVSVRRVANLAEIVVADNGEGIPAAFLPWVFEPFRQADGSTTRPHGGLGLGLSIVKHLVEAHGGTIRVASQGIGNGATFTVGLPIVPVPVEQREHEVVASSSSDTAAATLAGLSVLVVDDDDDNREVVTAQLQDRQATVLTAASAEEALSVLHSAHVDVLLADLAMPQQDGYALIRKVRASQAPRIASMPAAALTAFAREDDRQHVLREGFHVHLAKPIDAGSLVSAVASLGRLNVS